jgi:hypothetical protein
MTHVIEHRHRPNGDVLVVCRTCGILNLVPERLVGHVTGRHRARFFPEFRRRVPAWR